MANEDTSNLQGPGGYGDDSYADSPYAGDYPPFGLASATAISSTRVRLRYTAMFDAGFVPLLDVATYSIEPTLQVISVALESAQSVILTTDKHVAATYTVTVTQARGYFGQPLDPALTQRQFNRLITRPSFYAVATRDTRVRVVFSEPMLKNSELTQPTQYVLAELDGDPVAIARVLPEQTSTVWSVVLELTDGLLDEQHYRLTILSEVVSEVFASPAYPDTVLFQWVWNPLVAQVSVADFSGEVQDYSFGIPEDDPPVYRHGGLVFFSPALLQLAANSVIEVEEVKVCSRAYDQYHFPEQSGDPVNPWPFMTHGGVRDTRLNSQYSLWAGGHGLFPLGTASRGAGFGVGSRFSETVARPVDSECVATLSGPAGTVVTVLNADK